MKKFSIYILMIITALLLGACGKKEDDTEVSVKKDDTSVSVSDKTSAAEEQYEMLSPVRTPRGLRHRP